MAKKTSRNIDTKVDLKGQNVAAPIVPFSNLDIYPTHMAKFGKGGHRSVSNLAERDAIPIDRLESGCTVYVEETGTKYDCHIDDQGTISWTTSKEDQIYEGDLPMVTPTWNSLQWDIYKNDGTTKVETLTTRDIRIENGFKAIFSGKYIWTAVSGKKSPTAMASNSNFTVLTKSGVASELKTFPIVATNSTYRARMQAQQQGLIVVNGDKVIPATGVDYSEITAGVSFAHRLYYGRATSVNYDFTKLQSTELITSKVKTITDVTCSTSEYYVYAYPKSLGDLSSIIQDGALPILGAFTKTEKTITNTAGISIVYNVYTSNNKGAFTNSKLAFS